MNRHFKGWCILVLALYAGLSRSVQALPSEYFVALDALQTLPTGTYAGLANPNAQRLTFLFAHPNDANPSSNHFHGIGAYSYTGPAASPTVLTTNSNNRIPEISTGQPPLPLLLGTGNQAGRLLSQAVAGLEYSDLAIASIQALAGFAATSPEGFLFNSSDKRWISPLTGAGITLELVSISPGLQVADHLGSVILSQAGQSYRLGTGNTFSFTPVFFVDAATALPGTTYSATFRLHDVNTIPDHTPYLDSGTFQMDFVATPEPSTLALCSLGFTGLACAGWRRRQRRTPHQPDVTRGC